MLRVHLFVLGALGWSLQSVALGYDVEVHHVQLKGMASENAVRGIVDHVAAGCRQMGMAVLAAPDRLTEVESDIYYARQATIEYVTQRTFLPDPACKTAGSWQVSKRATIYSPKGVCSVNFNVKRATGSSNGVCHPEEFLVATNAVKRNFVPRQQDLGTRSVAGRSCAAARTTIGQTVTEYCVIVPSGFLPYRGEAGWRVPVAVKLYVEGKDDPKDAISIMEAQQVQERIRVPREIFLPHLTNGFKVMEGGRDAEAGDE